MKSTVLLISKDVSNLVTVRLLKSPDQPSISLLRSVRIPSADGSSSVVNVAVLVVDPIFILTL